MANLAATYHIQPSDAPREGAGRQEEIERGDAPGHLAGHGKPGIDIPESGAIGRSNHTRRDSAGSQEGAT